MTVIARRQETSLLFEHRGKDLLVESANAMLELKRRSPFQGSIEDLSVALQKAFGVALQDKTTTPTELARMKQVMQRTLQLESIVLNLQQSAKKNESEPKLFPPSSLSIQLVREYAATLGFTIEVVGGKDPR